MNLDTHLRICLHEESHLAETLIGHEDSALEIRAEIRARIERGLIGLYTYDNDAIRDFTKAEALSIVDDLTSWAWQSPSGTSQTFFLCRGPSAPAEP